MRHKFKRSNGIHSELYTQWWEIISEKHFHLVGKGRLRLKKKSITLLIFVIFGEHIDNKYKFSNIDVYTIEGEIIYLVQLTLGISKCSVRLSRCRLNSSTLCLWVFDAFWAILSFCCKRKHKWEIWSSTAMQLVSNYGEDNSPFSLAVSRRPILL